MKRFSIVLLLPVLLAACTSSSDSSVSLSNTHIHGLAVDHGDSSRVYVATHHGTFVLRNDTDLTLIDIDADPTSGSLFLATPNGIVRMSPGVEGSVTFDRIGSLPDNAVSDQVALDRKNPQVLYATSETTVYKSSDGGKTWQKIL